MKDKERGANPPQPSRPKKKVRLLRYLALAALVSSLAASGSLAKFSSSFGANISARVAAFVGGGSFQQESFDMALEDIAPGQPKALPFTVKNFEGDAVCQVRMNYSVEVETTGNLPLVFRLNAVGAAGEGDSLAGDLRALTEEGENGEEVAVSDHWIADAGSLPPVSESSDKRTHSYELIVNWDESKKEEDYSNEIDMVTVTVTAVQADPGGSD